MILSGTYGGIEAGGTKFKCIVGRNPDEVLARTQFPTCTPGETLSRVIEFFLPFCEAGKLRAVGLASFGPCDLRRGSPTYGFVTSTPKPGWRDTDVVGLVQSGLSVDVAFDTDVNAAALGERAWGATMGLDTSLYVTVGTGIGAGLIAEGTLLHGLQHPEMGHIRIPHDNTRDPFPGSCPYHGDCFEGLASGSAIRERFGRPGEDLSDDDPFWELEADYIALALANYILITSPQRIVLGGGIMRRQALLPHIRDNVARWLAGYVQHRALTEGMEDYIVEPALGSESGVLGALALASAASRDL